MFEVLEKRERKRLGIIRTLHGDIYTPAFGPDATRGLVKNIAPHELYNLSGTASNLEINNNKTRRENNETQFLLTNTYHIRSYPGDQFINEMGGIHEFMQWPLPILTDSGGFQVFSLIHKAKSLKGKITDNGAVFNHPVTGEKLELTPEIAIDIQFNLGSDIMVVLDDPRDPDNHKEMEASVYRTIEWAKRSKKRFEENLVKVEKGYPHLYKSIQHSTSIKRPLLFAVVQGGNDLGLRKLCMDELEKIGFDGYGYGGYPKDNEGKFPYKTLEYIASIMPEDKPRYALGVGTPENILKCIEYGWDLFDCVIPSRNARHALCYTSAGEIKIQNSRFRMDKTPLDTKLDSIASGYPKYYLHHLFKVHDALGGELLTIHNLKYFNYLMQKPFKEIGIA
jgi:queuine tRNA-ribosyltransferase